MSRRKITHRVNLDPDGSFDEIVIGTPCWFHLERMDTHEWFLSVGDRAFWFTVSPAGLVKFTGEETR